MANRFLAGVGRALLFRGSNLIGVAKTLTDSTFSFSITGEEIRGGGANALWGKYFHDSALNVTLTDAMFNLEYIAAALGTDVEMGGLSVYESPAAGETIGAGGVITLSNPAVPFDGTILAWYKRPSDENWTIATVSEDNTITIPGATATDHYCIKYFYNNENARSLTIKTQYVPSELHVVILNDLFNGDISTTSTETTKIGRLITDIPRLQMDGSQDLSLSASGAATVNLTGSALAVGSTTSCEEDPYYGTMTEEIFGASWQDSVVAIAPADGDIELADGESQTIGVYAIFGGSTASQLKANSNFTFTVESGTSATVTTDGVVSTSTGSGETLISVTLTGYDAVSPAFVRVTKTA